jgi:acetylornithine deacetylase/succinyl-diaminopimelate desuccinylase-like protein
VTLNGRLLPGENIENFVAELKRVVADDLVELTWRQGKALGKEPSPASHPVFRALAGSAVRVWPGARVIPFMSTGATDSAELRAVGVHAYGILPFPLTEEDEGRMHGHDERVAVRSFREGLEFIYRAVEEIAFAQ